MSAISKITDEENKTIIEDDLSNLEVKVNADKLAALKAKNKAKQEQMITTPKKERSLNLGIIGTGQGGCVDGSTNIYVSDYGIISIKEFFYNLLNSEDIKNIDVKNGNDTCISLKDKDIYTVSIDPDTGDLKKARVLAVWKNKFTSRNTITLNNSTSLTCSKTHPSLIFRPLSRRKAFFKSLSETTPLTIGDRLMDTRLSVLDLISKKTFVREIEITPEIAWLLGAFAGDGHNQLLGNCISFYSDDDYFTKKIIDCVNLIPNSSLSIFDKPGCKQIAVYGIKCKLFFESAFEFTSKNTYGGMGGKTYTIKIPKCISAANSCIRASFLSGLIDSDGTVYKNWCETQVFTTSKILSDQLGCLISSIGGRSCTETIMPRKGRENESIGYRIKLSGKINHGPMFEYIVQQLSHSVKKERLLKYLNKSQSSFTTSCVPIKFEEVATWFKNEGGMKTANNLFVNSTVKIEKWISNKRLLSISSFNKVLNSLVPVEQINYLKSISSRLIEIKSISFDNLDSEFFDLSVETYENYLAGNNGFIFTHNSNIGSIFNSLGYNVIALNTAIQDLKYINIPDSNKLLLEYGLGGAAKELEIGREAAESHRSQIIELINNKLSDAMVHVLCLSLGGGSGAGSCETLVDILSDMGKPLVVIAALPMDTEDAHTKSNALDTLSKLANLTKNKKVNNLIIVDNAKIQSIYQNVNQLDFFNVANKAIVEPIDMFNTLSSLPSAMKSFDPMEFSKVFLDSEGLCIYGEFDVDNYEEDTAIAEAVINNLANNLLATGFDLKQAKYVGYIVVANKEVWSKIPASSIDYASSMINDFCGSPKGIFKGIYCLDIPDNSVKVYSMFSGLGLPSSRVEQLKSETKELQSKIKTKDENRNLTLNLDTGNENVSAAQKVKDKIAAKSSLFGKFVNGVVSDRRK